MITHNHVHLLIFADEHSDVPRSVQLAAGRTGQEYNTATNRHGAFWEDRYHATAVATGRHLLECITYIDLNMVRTGEVEEPADWDHCGLYESLNLKNRYRIIDTESLLTVSGFSSMGELNEYRLKTAHEKIQADTNRRIPGWSESIGIGDEAFIETLKAGLGFSEYRHTTIAPVQGSESFELREPHVPLKDSVQCLPNAYLWNEPDN